MQKKKDDFIPTIKSYKKFIIVIIVLTLIYVLDNSKLVSYIDNAIYLYVIKPFIWIGVAIFIYKLRNFKPSTKTKYKKQLYFWSFYFSVFYILINIFAGFFDGFGKSPYDQSIKGIITNLVFVGFVLIGREFARNYIVNSIIKKENYLFFIFVSLFMTIINISFSRYLALNNIQDTVKFFAQFFGPEFSQNLFMTYLVYLGGPWTSIIYLGIIQCFQWFSPILPALKWINTALIGIMSPVFFLMFINSIYIKISRVKVRPKDKESIISWVITSIFSICIIWFAVGVFPIYPSVIATGSMKPLIKPGDIIIVEKIRNDDDINKLKVNDIIQFKRDEILISHRILEIKNKKSQGISFKTKGDNNSAPDTELVKPQDVKGIIKYTLPKIGLLTLLIKSNGNISLEEIEF